MTSPSITDVGDVFDVIDVIDRLAGLRAGAPVDLLRQRRPQAREHAQQSHLALFEPAEPDGDGTGSAFTRTERFAVAAFVATLHTHPGAAAFYAAALADSGATPALRQAIEAEAAAGHAQGPYGRYPAGPLSAEDVDGPQLVVAAAHRAVLGARLSAALAHAHLLVFHPRDASAAALQALLDAGWSTTEIVTLSQLIAFLAFQIRVVIGLQALAAHPPSASSFSAASEPSREA